MTASTPPSLFARRFVIVSGKGGVGKSTVSGALALAAATCGLRTCLLQLDTRDTLGPVLGVDASVYEPVRVQPDVPLWLCNLEPRQALREYGVMKLRFAALHRIVFENDVMRRLLRMIPGMDETLLLGKAWFMEEQEVLHDGTPKWDLLVVDAPSTGHGVSFFRLPEVLLQAMPVGPMAEDARRMGEMLSDPARCSFNIVTLPQELPVNEALELYQQAQEVVRVPTGYVIVNQVLPELIGDADVVGAEADAHRLSPHGAAARLTRDAFAYARWRALQQAQIARLSHIERLISLPHLLRPLDESGLQLLSQRLLREVQLCPLPSQDAS